VSYEGGPPREERSPESAQYVLYEVANGVAHLTLNRPERRNGLGLDLVKDLEVAVQRADSDDAVKVLLLQANGPSFCGGYDVTGLAPVDPPPFDPESDIEPGWDRLNDTLYTMRRDGEFWLRLFWNLRKPVVAAVHGACLAGGVDLIGAVDIVIVADDALIGLPQARALGVIHTMGLLPYYIGIRKSKEMAFSGDPISGLEAERLGLANKSVPVEKLAAEATWTAERIALVPRQLLMAHKFAINRFVEEAGLEGAVRASGEYDAIGAQNWMNAKFRYLSKTEGIKAAAKWRDAIWNEQEATRPS
jgi:enoyl-CoA hydratase